jgi:predicted aldo/keto reductase-like oxidoreductase
MKKSFNRRAFIKNTSLGALAAPLLLPGKHLPGNAGKHLPGNAGEDQQGNAGNDDPDAGGQLVKSYKTLGRTGFRVSDIGIGAPPSEAVLKAALTAGMNYIDTAEQYGNGNNEAMIGKVIRDFDRKKIFISTKIFEEGPYKSRQDVVGRVRKAVERLQSDYVDCVMLHGADNTRILKDEAFHGAMDQLKAEGRVRYVGVSCHGSAWYLPPEEDLDAVLLAAVDDGRFDVFLMTYNFVNREKAERVLRACAEKKVGTSIMKSNPMITFRAIEGYVQRMEESNQRVDDTMRDWHSRLMEENNLARELFGKYGYGDGDEEMLGAAIRFVIGNPDAHTVCLPFKSINDVEKWGSNSGRQLTGEQASLLDFYRRKFGYLNCRIGCRECAPACPHNVQVSTIMRYNYYFQNKGQEKYAMEKYTALEGSKADVCRDCPGYCQDACPYGVLARPMLGMAHLNLALNLA